MTASFLSFDLDGLGYRMHRLMAELYPICRSITGEGLRSTLRILQRYIPLQVYEIPSGTRVFDWDVPDEWNIRDAYIKGPSGDKVVDFNDSNLHVLQYSLPTRRKLSLNELKMHLYSIPEHPDWIPYKTSYYKANWGFCLSHRVLEALPEGQYEVLIDSSIEPGSLTYGEYLIQGECDEEVLISCHSCHPSLCNDNLSGMVLAVFLANLLSSEKLHYTYRFLFIPGTIGSIAWLANHANLTHKIKHGLVVACVGDSGKPVYKKSRQGDAIVDRAVQHVLQHSGDDFEILEFVPYGYDERQYCSPGFNLPVGSLTRTPHGQFAEYHTSADNLEFVQAPYLADSLQKYLKVMQVLERNRTYLNTHPMCEPQLGRRGLYGVLGGRKDSSLMEMAILWVLNYSDGAHSLLEIAETAGLSFDWVYEAAQALMANELLIQCESVQSMEMS